MDPVRACVGKAIVSDLAAGGALLLAAAEGAFLNVRINAAYLTDKALADRAVERALAVLADVRGHQSTIATTVDRMLA
jgi:formiminotetrahydrofolate cyclodeaminase